MLSPCKRKTRKLQFFDPLHAWKSAALERVLALDSTAFRAASSCVCACNLQEIVHTSETGIGGVKTYRTLEGGELAPKVAPRRLRLLTPKLAIFYRISVERGQFQGPLKIQNFHPPSNFRRFDTPYPGLQTQGL